MGLQLKGFKNIAVFKKASDGNDKSGGVAFHAYNLEVAKVTESLFQSMPLSGFQRSTFQDRLDNNISPIERELNPIVVQDIENELKEWSEKMIPLPPKNISYKVKSINLNVTQICNLHCTYCAAGGDGTYGNPVRQISVEKTLPQLKFFINKLAPGDRFHISFLGGEPLLYPEGIQLVCEYVTELALEKKLHLTFKITTNGTLMNEKIISILKTYKPVLVISMDGPPEINDVLRPQKNKESTSALIIKNLKHLLSLKNEIGLLGVHAVFSRENMHVEEAYRFFCEFSFDFMDFMFSVTENNKNANLEFMQKMEKISELAWVKGGEKELRKIYIFDHYFDLLDEQRRLENHCGLGKTLAVIDAQNKIYNCPWTVGKTQDQLGANLNLDEAKITEYTDSLIDRNQCQNCWARFLCGGGCSFIHQNTNSSSVMHKNELFCERTRYLIGLAIYYFSNSRELMT